MVGCDKLYEGIIIRLRLGEFAEIKITDEQAYAGAGVKWLRLLKKLNEHSIGGAEALVAVPGSVGGGVRMNAGAQGIETADFIDKIYALTPNGEQVIINNKDIEWNYRSCSLDKNLIITGADMNFKKVEPQNSQEQIQSVRQFRKNTQPGGRNPGCAFRNPGDDSAGRLIDKYGLKEFGIGNCQVSDIHANFLVNNKHASSSEYAELMRQVQTKIYEATGIILQQEVVFSDSTKIQAVKPLHIAVLKGGPSSEREISLESGAAVAKALRGGGHKVTEMDITEESLPTLPENCDLVFPVLHGEFGEDGQVQALIEATGTPYVGCGVESSQLCIDKYASVSALRKAELPVCDSIELTKDQRDMPSDFPIPCVVKPNRQGSTIGMSLVEKREELEKAIAFAFEYDETIIVEAFFKGIECTVGVLDGQAMTPVEIIPPDGFFDFDAKYTYAKGKTEYNCPPLSIPDSVSQRLKDCAEAAFTALKGTHVMRVDMIWNPDSDKFIILEANTLPGFTASSLLPKAAKNDGMSFTELCCKLALKGLQRI